MKKLLTLLTTLMLLFAITQSAMAQSYYMVGQLLKSNVNEWSEKNEDGYKFETTDHVNYFYTVYNTKANFDFRFRIGTEGNSKPTSYHPITVETSGTHKNGSLLKKDEPVTGMEQSASDNYWYFIMEAYNSYTFHFNANDKSLHVTKGTTLGKAKDFEMVAEYKNAEGTTVQEMIVPFIESRVRKERDKEMHYSDILATAAFKDEQLPGKKGDKIRIYARKRDDNSITLNPATDGSTFGEERQPAYDNNSSYSSIKSYKTESFVINRPENAFVITKGSGVSYTVALNLGGKIKTESGKDNLISHYVEANSLSLFINKSMSEVYKNYFEDKKPSQKYDEKNVKFYLIGAMDGKTYNHDKVDDNLMERTVYTNPITNETDSIVYTKLVEWKNNEPNGLWFSFAPEFIYDSDLGLQWNLGSAYDAKNAWNLIARAQVQDEYDATAQYGCMNISGHYGNVLCNGEQALNPKVKDPKYKYYVVRFNVTTSTYRLIFYEENPVIIKRSKNKYIRTFSSNANWDLPTDGTVKAYVVHSFDKDAKDGGLESQGVMRLREIKYIPAEMGVVLVGNGTEGTGDEMKVTLRSRWTDLVTSENMRDLWKKDYPENETFNNYLVGLPTDGADITEGDYDEENHCYVNRNFALNWFSNTKTGQSLIADHPNLKDKDNGDAGTANYLGFFRLNGKVNKEYAYLKLSKSVVDYDLQLTGGKKENDKDIKEWDAKLSPNFALEFDTDFGTVSGINSLSNTKKNVNNSCYTLQGVKVQRPTAPGLYIMNGKKVIVK